MKKSFILFVLLFCSQVNIVFAQSFFEILGTSHYARVIRLGNAYAGIADGTEAIYYNVAGLAALKGYSALYSDGQGYAFYLNDPRLIDYALAFQLPDSIGTAALSMQSFTSPTISDDFGMYIYALSFARKLFNNFSAGINFNYYHSKGLIGIPQDPLTLQKYSASGFDFNLGLIYQLPAEIKLSKNDKFSVGFQIKNLLNNKLHYDVFDQESKLFQEIRLGLGYIYHFPLGKINGFNLLTIQFSTDAVFQGRDYDFTEWQPNYGVELTAIEIIQLSFGRENEIQIKKTYDSSPQHPVNRYGIGLNFPVEKIIELPYKCHINVNYCISDWQKIDEDKASGYPFYIDEFDNNAFSVGITITP